MSSDSFRSLTDFDRAVQTLSEFLSTPVVDDRDRAGVIHAFEYCFELSWKTLQKLLVQHNKIVGSPKQAFKAAFEIGWIQESEHDFYLKMIADRNLTSHTYKEDLAREVLARIEAQHLGLLKNLVQRLKSESDIL